MQTITIKIDGMTCSGCVKSVENVLKNIVGVHSVEVLLDHAQATIQYDAERVDTVQFKEAIINAGFEVSS